MKTAALIGTLCLSAFLYSCQPQPQTAASANVSVETEFSFTSTFDSTRQQAVAFIPDTTVKRKRPLLVVAHYWWGNRFTARDLEYYPECVKRGWLLVCPELHGKRTGHETPLAALECQHDIVDAVRYMQAAYQVDSSRIYIAGRSMGGMIAQMMAAKYPDLFAAAAAGQGISDLKAWIDESPMFREGVEKECGPYDARSPFEYVRRSSVSYASNLAFVPLFMWHGTNDTWVPTRQSDDLHREISRYSARVPGVFWLYGAPHCDIKDMVEWECGQLSLYRNVSEAGMEVAGRFYPDLSLVTDEDKAFFWLELERADAGAFGTVTASVKGDLVRISAGNLKKVTVILDKIAKSVSLARYEFAADRAVALEFRRNGAIVASVAASRSSAGPVALERINKE